MKGRGDKSVARRKADKKIKKGDGGRVLAAMKKNLTQKHPENAEKRVKEGNSGEAERRTGGKRQQQPFRYF